MNQRTSSPRQPVPDGYSHQEILDEILRRWPGIEHDPELQARHLPRVHFLEDLKRRADGATMTLDQWHASRKPRPPYGWWSRCAYFPRWKNGRRLPYDPWMDLAYRRDIGVPFAPTVGAVEWFNPGPGADKDLGHTLWWRGDSPVIQLNVRQTEQELRTTLTHELIHVERGPVPAHLQEDEEAAIELLTAHRLIDPDGFDSGLDALALGVDEPCRDRYAGWRREVSAEEAALAWEVATWGFLR